MAKKKHAEHLHQMTCQCYNTSDEHVVAICVMPVDLACWLINVMKPMVDKAVAGLSTFYSIEVFDASCEYGQGIRGDGVNELPQAEPDEKWRCLPPDYEMDDLISTAAQILVATKTGVLWTAADKNADHRMETVEISWKQIQEIADGKNPLSEVKILE